MSDLSWLAMSVLTAMPGMTPNAMPVNSDLPPLPTGQGAGSLCRSCQEPTPAESLAQMRTEAIAPAPARPAPQFSPRPPASAAVPPPAKTAPRPLPDPAALPNRLRPTTGSQQYQQRQAALRAGMTYTRLPVSSFWAQWSPASTSPTYEQWVSLLRGEAQAMVRGQGSNRLEILLGDSISQWFPMEQLSGDRFWLNQGISGDTTSGVLRRLSTFAQTRPNRIHLMIGINDLRRGASDQEVLVNIDTLVRRLQQQHPQAQIVLYSILPTRLATLPSPRIQSLNRVIAAIARHTNSQYVDLQTPFSDNSGILRRDLTTDGLHLSHLGYALWGWLLQALG